MAFKSSTLSRRKIARAKVILMSGFDARVLSLARGIGAELGLDMGLPLQKPFLPSHLRKVLSDMRGMVFQPDRAALCEALDSDRLELFYQPLVAIETQKTIGFEALVRWQHPEFGMVMPDQFIALAEREDLIGRVTDRVLDVAIRQIGAWRKAGIDSSVAVNISAANILANLPDQLELLCTQYGVPPRCLHLELTETAAMGAQALMLQVLTRVRLKGFHLAIDDFGTGYSSLVQLHRLPFTDLKIDRSFVSGLGVSEEANVIVGAIIGLGHNMNMRMIAEGTETEKQLMQLKAMDCETTQGFYFSRAMPAADVPKWVSLHA